MKHAKTYTQQESEQILKAYQALLPSIPPELGEFMDVKKQRDWSVLTSDFRSTTYADFQRFHESLVSINDCTKPCEFGMVLAELSKAHKVGFSHGFSPWTDTMLLETFSSKTRRLLIILGHDWYPIVTHNFDPKTSKGYAAISPLICQSPRDEYAHALPNSLTSHPDRAIVFMNLYPDFRPPCADCTGEVGADKFVAAFSACCREFAKNYTIDAVVSWGAPVWQALRKIAVNGARKKPEGIKAAALSGPFNLESQGLTIPYYPFAHPCHRGNFNQAAHFEKFQSVCTTI